MNEYLYQLQPLFPSLKLDVQANYDKVFLERLLIYRASSQSKRKDKKQVLA